MFINRRLITLKRFFEWALTVGLMSRNPAKPVNLLQREKVSPRQMTDKERSCLDGRS